MPEAYDEESVGYLVVNLWWYDVHWPVEANMNCQFVVCYICGLANNVSLSNSIKEQVIYMYYLCSEFAIS